MRILMAAVNAKYIHSNLAVYSLRAASGSYAPLVELAEYTVNQRTEEIFRSIYGKKPQLLFFSCYIWNRGIVVELAEDLHKVLPDLTVWIGGPEVSHDAEEFLREYPQVDGVMRGEGEQTFRKLLEYYVDGTGTLEEISGITYRAGGICSSPPPLLMKTLDGLPFVYGKPEDFAHRIIYYESSRGCPFSCSYCLSSIDREVRFRSLALVEQELSIFLEHKVPQVKFVDRTFNCSHERTLRLWRFLKEHDNGVTNFHFEIAANLLNEEETAVLAEMRPGLVQLEIGVQTVNPRTLEAIHRTAGFEEIARRVEQIAGAGNVRQHLDLIAGLPYEDFESFCHSFDAVYRLHPQELQLGFLKVLKGSEMHRRAEEYGIIYRSRPPYEVLATRWITCEELLRLKEIEELLEIYYNSGQFGNTMTALEEIFERPYELYAALADYGRANRTEGMQYSRQQRFEFLRGFVRELWEAPAGERMKEPAYYDELMTLDCYLRENAKTRPAWAPDQKADRARITEFYQREECERRYLTDYEGATWKQMMRMTHLERFSCLSGMDAGTEKWILFDYSHREPLTGNAAAYEADVP